VNSETTQLLTLVGGWQQHFAAADRDIRWLHAERPITYWLTEDILLAGVIDADGITPDGERFFGEWKTASPREKKTWKQVWRKNPQSLTYGVLMDSAEPGCRSFTVRKAFKEAVPTYDHAWYSYSTQELNGWRDELCGIAAEMRAYAEEGLAHWPLNFTNCFKYGPQYACPFFEQGCDKEQWGFVPVGSLQHKEQPFIEAALMSGQARINGALVLSPSRVSAWLSCREFYRKLYRQGIELPPTDALTLGGDFHHTLAQMYKEKIHG
jgi:hypothetical protein